MYLQGFKNAGKVSIFPSLSARLFRAPLCVVQQLAGAYAACPTLPIHTLGNALAALLCAEATCVRINYKLTNQQSQFAS
jgi:hypothetical protein